MDPHRQGAGDANPRVHDACKTVAPRENNGHAIELMKKNSKQNDAAISKKAKNPLSFSIHVHRCVSSVKGSGRGPLSSRQPPLWR